MKDEAFINELLQKGSKAKEKVSIEFSGMSLNQLNWQASSTSWSIAQCLDHLIRSHSIYFTDLQKISRGEYKMNFWNKYSPFTKLCGRLLKERMQEEVKKKMKAPGKIQPSSNFDPGIIEQYHKNLDIFLQFILNCNNIDIDKTILTSPTIPIVTYSLRDAFYFLLTHEHRHINQAVNVKTNKEFPKSITF